MVIGVRRALFTLDSTPARSLTGFAQLTRNGSDYSL